MDGDNILLNLGRAFDRPPNNGASCATAAIVLERLPIGQSSNNRREVSQEASHLEHDNDNYCAEGSEIPPSGNITIRDVRPIAQDATERVHPPPHLREAMGQEFPLRRDYETDSQYENRYVAQQRRINNTQQS